jgi:Phosphotransferase enzyme family
MTPFEQPDLKTFRLIVLRRDGSEILLTSSEAGWSLPCVSALPRKRIADELVTELNELWGLNLYCLFILDSHAPNGENYAVLESITQSGEAAKGNCWTACKASRRQITRSIEDNNAIKESLRQLDECSQRSEAGPFGRLGWLEDLFIWAQEQLTPLGLRVNGKFQQFNASQTFSLIRIETNGPAVWFKATGEPNRHELSITASLTGLFPGKLPVILGVHLSWNGWLSEEVSRATLDEFTEVCVWERVASELAELQIAAIGKDTELLGAGCKDLRLPILADLIDPFFARMAEFMAAQEKKTPPPLTKSELSLVASRLKESCSLLHDLRLPHSLGHIDFNPGNVLVSPDRIVFIDWAEACVTNPLVTFEYLLAHARRSHINDVPVTEKITATYLRPWQAFLSPYDLARAMTVSSLIAVFAYAVAGKAWLSPDTLQDSRRSGYLRSLTRRMYREATQTSRRREQCVA